MYTSTKIGLRIFLLMIAILFIGYFAYGCGGRAGINDVASMSANERAAWMLGVYNSQYADHRAMTGYVLNEEGEWVKTFSPNLTMDQREMLQKKKKLLNDIYPLILIYTGYIDSGVSPSAETEQQIIDMINQLYTL